jgi:hypothetical protein
MGDAMVRTLTGVGVDMEAPLAAAEDLAAFELSGCVDETFNGLWVRETGPAALVNGCRHFRNELGYHCFHTGPKHGLWLLHCELGGHPNSAGCEATLKAEGALPRGTKEWRARSGFPFETGWTPTELTLTQAERAPRVPFCDLGLPLAELAPSPLPVTSEVVDHARFLGIDLRGRNQLRWLAEEALLAPLLPGWREHVHPQCGALYFHHESEKIGSSWHHPLEQHYVQTAFVLQGCLAQLCHIRTLESTLGEGVDLVAPNWQAHTLSLNIRLDH